MVSTSNLLKTKEFNSHIYTHTPNGIVNVERHKIYGNRTLITDEKYNTADLIFH
jgi:hypothetical protein